MSKELRGDGGILEGDENSEAIDDNQAWESEVVPENAEPCAGCKI